MSNPISLLVGHFTQRQLRDELRAIKKALFTGKAALADGKIHAIFDKGQLHSETQPAWQHQRRNRLVVAWCLHGKVMAIDDGETKRELNRKHQMAIVGGIDFKRLGFSAEIDPHGHLIEETDIVKRGGFKSYKPEGRVFLDKMRYG